MLFPRRAAASEVKEAEGPYDALARHLEAISSPTRLELLRILRTPQTATEIRVGPTLSREGENPERPLTRQAISRHLDVLMEAGLVRRLPAGRGGKGDLFVLNHERLFAVVDEMRGLSRLRPTLLDGARDGTMAHAGSRDARPPAGPRLLVAYGRDDGVAYSLAEGARWRIGRGENAQIVLDYDPYTSSDHCEIVRRGDAFFVVDLASRNGTWVDWARLPAHGEAALRPGSLLIVGRTNLVFQS